MADCLTLQRKTRYIHGRYRRDDRVGVIADSVPEGYVFAGWKCESAEPEDADVEFSDIDRYVFIGYFTAAENTWTSFVMRSKDVILTAVFRKLEYFTLTLIKSDGTTERRLEAKEPFEIDAYPIPEGYTFVYFDGDTHGLEYAVPPFNTWQRADEMGYGDRTIRAVYHELQWVTVTVIDQDKTYTVSIKEESSKEITASGASDPGQRFKHWVEILYNGREKVLSTNPVYNCYIDAFEGDRTIKAVYVKLWDVSIVNGVFDTATHPSINGTTHAVLDQGESYGIKVRDLEVYERFDGWTIEGEGRVGGELYTKTYFVVGDGPAIITANISQYPDKTLTIKWRPSIAAKDELYSQETYRYGSSIPYIEAPVAPDKMTFLSWVGDVGPLKPSALASTVSIDSLTTDTTIIATYYYPEVPKFYPLTVYNGQPTSGSYAAGTLVPITANDPGQNWEFNVWVGDTAYLVNPDITNPSNAVLMPYNPVTLTAKYNVIR